MKVKCKYCEKVMNPANLGRHEEACFNNPKNYRECPVCESQILSKDGKTCSYKCANTYFRSGENNPNFRADSSRAHIAICFQHHKYECVVCGENRLVAVHHYDENNKNNDPKNLVPLCALCHGLYHSRFRADVEQQIEEFISV